ncbi:hypothetical protein X801_10125, partial [Opisthorchis viverrini]
MWGKYATGKASLKEAALYIVPNTIMSGRTSQMVGVSNITNRTDPNSLKSRVFVGNLNTVHMTKTELESIFSKYGAIIGISVHKGYAFIQYGNETSARAAVAGEDAKIYYSMALDVTIASEPKNRKRGRSNINANLSTCSGIPDLTLQAQALSSLASNPVLSSLQQLGLEGIMGQPNFSQFAAAATSVLGGATPLTGFNFGAAQNPVVSATRPKHTRSSGSQPSSYTPVSALNTSSSAKRTRLESMLYNQNSSNNTLPAGARGQNLVSLVSPTADNSSSTQPTKVSPASDQRHPGSSLTTSSQARSVTASMKTSTPSTVTAPSKRPLSNTSVATSLNRTHSETSGRSAAEDILICGSCRRLFDQVDELISHKMAGCSLNQGTCHSCRCRSGEPEILECAYCGASFHSAWDLMHHCHNDHGLTIYTIPSPTPSPASTVNSSSTQATSFSTSKKTSPGAGRSNGEEIGSASQTKIKTEMMTGDTSEHDRHETQSQDDIHEGSDWERDPDEYDVGPGISAHNDEQGHSTELSGTHSPSCSPVLSPKCDLEHNGGANEESVSSVEKSPNHGLKETAKPNESLHGHRRRGGEYGRHETMADDEDEDAVEDDEPGKVDAI